MPDPLTRRPNATEKKHMILCETSRQADEAEGSGNGPPTPGRFYSGSALIRSRGDAPGVVETLVETFRRQPFGDQGVFAIRVALEVAIDAVLTTGQGMRVRYHMGPDGLLLDVEPHETVPPMLPVRAMHLMRHFMTEVQVHERGVTLFRGLAS
jgi:hypothetical protein